MEDGAVGSIATSSRASRGDLTDSRCNPGSSRTQVRSRPTGPSSQRAPLQQTARRHRFRGSRVRRDNPGSRESRVRLGKVVAAVVVAAEDAVDRADNSRANSRDSLARRRRINTANSKVSSTANSKVRSSRASGTDNGSADTDGNSTDSRCSSRPLKGNRRRRRSNTQKLRRLRETFPPRRSLHARVPFRVQGPSSRQQLRLRRNLPRRRPKTLSVSC